MNAGQCPREDELLDALGRGYVGAELSAHTDRCRPCGELRAVAGALLDERSAAMTEAPVPNAASMWFHLQIRQQQEAQSRVRRSLITGQAVTLVGALALVISLLGADLAVELKTVIASIRLSAPLLLTAAILLLIAPIAGWVAIRQR
jgi:hypothetical protein